MAWTPGAWASDDLDAGEPGHREIRAPGTWTPGNLTGHREHGGLPGAAVRAGRACLWWWRALRGAGRCRVACAFPDRAGPFRAGPDRSAPGRDGPFRAGPGRDGPFKVTPGRSGGAGVPAPAASPGTAHRRREQLGPKPPSPENYGPSPPHPPPADQSHPHPPAPLRPNRSPLGRPSRVGGWAGRR
ncbi:protein of unknown function [Streptomyces murinus]